MHNCFNTFSTYFQFAGFECMYDSHLTAEFVTFHLGRVAMPLLAVVLVRRESSAAVSAVVNLA